MLSQKELSLHKFQVKQVQLVSINATRNGLIAPQTHRIEYKLSGSAIISPGGTEGQSNLRLSLSSVTKDDVEEGTDSNLDLVLELQGICSAPENTPEAEFSFFLEFQSIALLWPYARQIVSDIMVQMNLVPYVLPTLDVTRSVASLIQNRPDKVEAQ